MWALAWWPHALSVGVHPIVAQAVWPPSGYNLAWSPASLPGPSLLLAPITRLFGPFVSYNILCISSPALAAFSTFVLCRYLSGQFWPAIVGGYIFGFSQYVLAHMTGHVNLLLIFPIPLAIYIVLLRLGRYITRTAFLTVLVPVLVLVLQLLCSSEIFATATVFGGLAIVVSYVTYEGVRRDIQRVTLESAAAYLVATIILTPYLYYIVARGVPAPIHQGADFSNDLLAFAVPTPVLYLGRAFSELVGPFKVGWVEVAAYLGPGLWIVLVLYTESSWSTQTGKFLIVSLILVGLMSLGPVLHIDGIARGPAPWRLVSEVPLIDQALPDRFGMYFFLVAAAIASLYLSSDSVSWWSRLLLSSLCVLSLAPNLAPLRSIVRDVRIPRFFRHDDYRRYLARNDNVLVLPYAQQGEDGLLWQIQTDFYFRLAAARLDHIPPEFTGWPVMSTLETGDEIMNFTEQFKAFLSAHEVKAVIIDPRAGGPWQRLLSEAGLAPLHTGGVIFYEVTPSMVARFRGATAHGMAEREASASFDAFLNAACRYQAAGFPLRALSPAEAQRLHLLDLPPSQSPSPADSHWWRNLWLGPWGESMVAIGIVGDYDNFRHLVDEYHAEATDIFFPFPKKLEKGPQQGSGPLVITFTSEALQRAASKTIGMRPASG